MTNTSHENQIPPGRPLDGIIAEALASTKQKAAAHAARRAQFEQVQPEPKRCIVAWVDLLGFREQICNADTPEKFQVASRRMRDVHEEFDKETASVYADQGELNAGLGKRIIALSDGLVIAQQLDDNPIDEINSEYEIVGTFLESMRLAQARCASVGNLVRGGIAIGYFWFEGDILLSPALVEAYKMESELAQNPVIILRRDLVVQLRSMKASEGYSDDFDPMGNLFRDCEWMAEPERSEHVMLDFMPIFLDEDDPTMFLRSYCQHLIDGRAVAPDSAKPKYDWLMHYAREFVAAELPSLEETIFGSPLADAAPVERTMTPDLKSAPPDKPPGQDET